MKKLIKYMFRWQLSTPILAIIPFMLTRYGINNFWVTALIANLIGSLIFFKIDEVIFSKEMTRFQRLRKKIIKRKKKLDLIKQK
jgi:hypothetical protein